MKRERQIVIYVLYQDARCSNWSGYAGKSSIMHVMCVECVDRNLCAVFVHVMCVWRMMCVCKMYVLQCEGMILNHYISPR